MKVKDMIAILKRHDPDMSVQVWDAYKDCATDKIGIHVHVTGEKLLIDNIEKT